ncbi:MAG: DNA replication and repair protein RecF [Bacteroidales bacterium]|nr:DNA replication and repair protein RecF [Bacteroidales bacterium]
MKLHQLLISQYKNNKESLLDFSSKVNIFVGDNGAGKTNILDAIYYLSFCKSPFNTLDNNNILHSESFFMLRGEYSDNEKRSDKVQVTFARGDRKRIKRNDKEYERIADHIGEFPLVIISPMDSNLIIGGSEERRKYIDGVISQFDRQYLHTLLNYNKVLQQRNVSLKGMAKSRSKDYSIIDILDSQLSEYGNVIHKKRAEFLVDFIPLIKDYYKFISNEKEAAGIRYRSQLNDNNFETLLKENQQRDLVLQHTSIGIHRDDLVFELDDYPIKKQGSQGQQKSFLVALKIAQFEYTRNKKGYKPLLLLDDIFDKLDYKRVKQLMKLVSRNEFGQIFITDTNKERIERIFLEIDVDKHIYEVAEGEINKA